MCTYSCAHEQKWSRTHTFHSYDQISFVRFLPPCPAPSAFQNSLTPSNDPGLPALTPTFLLLLDHTKSNISDNPFKSIYKYDMWQEKGCNSMRFSLYDNCFRCSLLTKPEAQSILRLLDHEWTENKTKHNLEIINIKIITFRFECFWDIQNNPTLLINFFFQWGMVLASLLSDIFANACLAKVDKSDRHLRERIYVHALDSIHFLNTINKQMHMVCHCQVVIFRPWYKKRVFHCNHRQEVTIITVNLYSCHSSLQFATVIIVIQFSNHWWYNKRFTFIKVQIGIKHEHSCSCFSSQERWKPPK